MQRVAEVTRRVAALWLAAVQAPDVPRPAGETEAAALAATNARLLHYSRLDPDAEVLRLPPPPFPFSPGTGVAISCPSAGGFLREAC